ncbi:MAG TPA: PEGA domain-containing protein [Kofleriaceae bacterium]|jgi:hypothetical protein
MKRIVAALACLMALANVVLANPDPKRKVIVLEFRSGSSALSGIANRIVSTLSKQTSLQVLGPDQVRATYGDRLTEALSKCAGDAECVSRIGARVGAAEVLLVGVSELGDVILTMQRIEVADHAVTARVADSLASGSTPTDDQISYYLARLLPPSDFLRFGVIDIIASQAGALVTIDKQPKGKTPIPPLKLHAPASYAIRIEKDGFTPFQTRVDLPPDGALKVEATLTRTSHVAWYAHWYVLAIGTILVAGAAGGGIYYATRPQPSNMVPVVVNY